MSDTENSAPSIQQTLIQSLQHGRCYDHATDQVELIETHISWLLLAGPYAYKIKKAINLGFLDYSELEQRHFFCDEEIRLNSRTAADIYLETVTINGTPEHPVINGAGPVVEYAVKMQRFPDDALLSHRLKAHHFSKGQLDQLAGQLARFHASIPSVNPRSPLGTPEAIFQPVAENFEQIAERVGDNKTLGRLNTLRDWSREAYEHLRPLFQQRHDEGFIRECHGDLHLNNMVQIDDEIQFFDGIEFNKRLRWIDVISELAFLIMDLKAKGRTDYARRLLNHYLSNTGDYAGLALLRFYIVYRAMVRAKVAAIEISQHPEQTETKWKPFFEYLELAEQHTQTSPAFMLITHGVSGSGKTYYSQLLAEALDIIHIRSDVERKRLHGLSALDESSSEIETGIYTSDATTRTYQHLLQMAENIIKSGYAVLIDATFLQHQWRDAFYSRAQALGIPYSIIHFTAPPEELEKRIQQRQAEKTDASEADIKVLKNQQMSEEELTNDEWTYTLTIDSSHKDAITQIINHLTAFQDGA